MALQITSPAGPSRVSVSAKDNFTTSYVTAVTANTEYTISIPSGTKSFRILADNNAKLLIASSPGDTSTDNAFPISPGAFWSEDLLVGSALTIYVSSNKNSTIIKILTWS